ncbi:hypothetical protein WOLCODRAFT_157509 [Wolfiporia cocos MD-104 SS10]|uniref:Uncharacterized protein n=1 Tax=Wolfiporia cocos (strain MD-104) TaxID=742152 RepID=A0A2H3JGJ7_WOLCO|nr:hypothetical protein WOLCODRAFT_157509 [Wolfiporia cocos MD-104 SS10]
MADCIFSHDLLVHMLYEFSAHTACTNIWAQHIASICRIPGVSIFLCSSPPTPQGTLTLKNKWRYRARVDTHRTRPGHSGCRAGSEKVILKKATAAPNGDLRTYYRLAVGIRMDAAGMRTSVQGLDTEVSVLDAADRRSAGSEGRSRVCEASAGTARHPPPREIGLGGSGVGERAPIPQLGTLAMMGAGKLPFAGFTFILRAQWTNVAYVLRATCKKGCPARRIAVIITTRRGWLQRPCDPSLGGLRGCATDAELRPHERIAASVCDLGVPKVSNNVRT